MFRTIHPIGRAMAVLAALYLAIGVLVAVALGNAWRDAQDAAATGSRNLALLVENYFVELFDQIDLGLLSLAHEATQHARSDRFATDRLDAFLARNITALSDTSRFGLADADGRVIYTTGGFSDRTTLQEYVTTQRFFVAGATPGASGLYIARRAEPTDPDGLYLSRRVETRNGDFIGVAFARLPLSQVEDFLSRLDIGPHGGISLRDPSMGIVVRYPDPQRLFRGNANVSPELRTLLDSGATRATYYSGRTWDGTARTVTFTRVGTYPLYVAIGLASADYLAEWRRTALLLGLTYAALLAAGAAGMAMLRRRRTRPADVS